MCLGLAEIGISDVAVSLRVPQRELNAEMGLSIRRCYRAYPLPFAAKDRFPTAI
ncbi:hypothetical protein BXY66_2386 [Shimia isoporae]|uniref:Uncharacterized protein n=1 Tax=Shimia isoporae TaxID=647720 RepID=A0A4R1NPB6_9RHOB|nr:hypothetical protein BXY66_2386 [Shimia isoporae]